MRLKIVLIAIAFILASCTEAGNNATNNTSGNTDNDAVTLSGTWKVTTSKGAKDQGAITPGSGYLYFLGDKFTGTCTIASRSFSGTRVVNSTLTEKLNVRLTGDNAISGTMTAEITVMGKKTTSSDTFTGSRVK